MKRKTAIWAFAIYLFFGFLMYGYLFYFADTTIPVEYKGSAADPEQFMNARELELSEEYSTIRNLLFFLEIPYEWLFYLLILIFGFSKAFEKWAYSSSKWLIMRTIIYTFWLSIFSFLAFFPFAFIRYVLAKTYHISVETFSSWMKSEMIDFWVNWGFFIIITFAIYWLIQKNEKRWWFYSWLLSIPFTVFLMYIQPVIIDPLYHEFSPLKNKELEEKILNFAQRAGIPAEHVFEVNMSEKTNALNAYVTGVGSNSRIVLWDTTLNRLDEDGVLFIMAHEMAHYVEKHIYFGIAGYLLLSFFGLFLTAKLLKWIVERFGPVLNITSWKNISSLPLILCIISVLSFSSSPLSNAVSRYQEVRADRYAIEMTENPKAAIESFQILTKTGLSQVNPPALVKWFRYTHPTMLERITFIENYQSEQYEEEKNAVR